jgi:hypothetical protein
MNFKPKTSASRNDVGAGGDASSDMLSVVVLRFLVLVVGVLLLLVGAPVEEDEEVVEAVEDEGLEGGVLVPIKEDEPWINACRLLFVVVAVGRKARDTWSCCGNCSSRRYIVATVISRVVLIAPPRVPLVICLHDKDMFVEYIYNFKYIYIWTSGSIVHQQESLVADKITTTQQPSRMMSRDVKHEERRSATD